MSFSVQVLSKNYAESIFQYQKKLRIHLLSILVQGLMKTGCRFNENWVVCFTRSFERFKVRETLNTLRKKIVCISC